MSSFKISGKLIAGGILTSISTSLCCITPVLALIAGSTGIASTFYWIEPARPFLISISILVLGSVWYRKLKRPKTNNNECSCKSDKESSFLQSNKFLGIVTVFAIVMMTFPLYAKIFYSNPESDSSVVNTGLKQEVKFNIEGMTCEACEEHVNNELAKVNGIVNYKTSYEQKNSIIAFDRSKVNVITIANAINKTGYAMKNYHFINSTTPLLTFYASPLVCHAAPTVGCGSKAKFMLLDLEKNTDEIEGVWLNRAGTTLAVKWKENISNEKKSQIVKTVSTIHEIEMNEINENETAEFLKSFPDANEWYKSVEVDKLSKEEAAFIAEKMIAGYKQKNLIKPSFEKQFQADIEKIFTELFLSITSYKDLNTEAYNKVEGQIQSAGEKYVGKGKMPHVELCISPEQSCEKDKSCCDKK